MQYRCLAIKLSDSSGMFEKIDRVNAADAVRDQLLDRLQNGTLSVGDKLPSENELARSFGVSRPVVREAIGTLRAWGIVTSKNGSGSFITALQPRRVGFELLGGYSSDDLHEVRCNLEIPAAGLAAARRTASDLRLLRRNVAAQRKCSELTEWARLDVEFHAILAAAAKNPVQERLVADLRDLHEDQSLRVLDARDRTQRALAEHETILAAVAAGDEAAARERMEAHLNAIYLESHELVAQSPKPRRGARPKRRGTPERRH
jgi:GntR family transcriptional repressor for pyruvate dehydrogenase complex